MSAFRSFRALAPPRRRLALRSLPVVLGIRVGLTALPYPRFRSILAAAGRRPPSPTLAAHSTEELAWAVTSVSRMVPRATCLVRALSLELLLRRSGRAAELRIGVAKEAGALKAHAWVEAEGKRLLEDADQRRFTVLPSTERI